MSVVVVLAILGAATQSTAQTFTTLYSFFDGADGQSPFGGLVADASGNYYGTTQWGGEFYYGTVFELSPPSSGGVDWTETVIWNFKGRDNGSSPAYRLAMDKLGNLFGETLQGGEYGSGTVFMLTPPGAPGGSWTERTIFVPAGYGEVFFGELLIDSAGDLYGTQFSGGDFGVGTAFKLTPGPDGHFVPTTLYSFGATDGDSEWPRGPLTMDSAGNLYGVSYGGGAYEYGTAYKLTRPAKGSTSWTNSVLYSFGNGTQGCVPEGNVILGGSGRVYGQTAACGALGNGVFFRLTPSASGPWTESVLYAFSTTDGGNEYPTLAFDAKANVFYGTSFYGGGNGVVYELSPPEGEGDGWTDTVLYSFAGGTSGGNPVGPIAWDANGTLYGAATSLYAPGTLFSIVP